MGPEKLLPPQSLGSGQNHHSAKLILSFQYAVDSLGPRTVSFTKCWGTTNEPDALMCTWKEKAKKNKKWGDTGGFISLFTQIIDFFNLWAAASIIASPQPFILLISVSCKLISIQSEAAAAKPSWIKSSLQIHDNGVLMLVMLHHFLCCD